MFYYIQNSKDVDMKEHYEIFESYLKSNQLLNVIENTTF